MKSILDPAFQYTTSFNTDLKTTFARILRDRQKGAERAAPVTADVHVRISTLAGKTATDR